MMSVGLSHKREMIGETLVALLFAIFTARSQGTAIFLVPVYDWTLIWKDTRNFGYVYGSIWRPSMIVNAVNNISAFPGNRNFNFDQFRMNFLSKGSQIVHLGDVVMPGYDPPNFVGNVLVFDPNAQSCPSSIKTVGIPCFVRLDSAAVDPTQHYTGYLTITPQASGFQSVWASKTLQCVNQTSVGVPALCSPELQRRKLCSVYETGFQAGEVAISFQRPTCPDDYYVLGHVALQMANGTIPAEQPMQEYKCLHETLLRKGAFLTTPTYTGQQQQTSPFSSSLIQVQWAQPVSLWQSDCSLQSCYCIFSSCEDNDICQDTITQGLFYASASETAPDPKIVLAQNVGNTVGVGPRCLTWVRDCTTRVGQKWITNTGPGWDGTSNCDAELGYTDPYYPSVIANGVPSWTSKLPARRGLLSVVPRGIPGLSSTTYQLVLTVTTEICDIISSNNYLGGTPEGIVLINGIETNWVDFGEFNQDCRIIVTTTTTQITHGPAVIDIQSRAANASDGKIYAKGILQYDFQKQPAFVPIGTSIDKLYIYVDPTSNLQLIEPIVTNGPACQTIVVIQLPPTTQSMRYGDSGFQCQWKDPSSIFATWNDISTASMANRAKDGYVGVVCSIPARTASSIRLRYSMTSTLLGDDFIIYHESPINLTRTGVLTQSYKDDTVIPGQGALRVYGITPINGPEGGGTKITAFGQYFSIYCSEQHCNHFICRFRFVQAGKTIDSSLIAQYVDDQTLTCVSPAAVPGNIYAIVEFAVDYSGPCNSRMLNSNTPSEYNFFQFNYQTSGTISAIPAATQPINADPRVAPHRLQGDWVRCNPNATIDNTDPNIENACGGFPQIDPVVASKGYISCLSGFFAPNAGNFTPNMTEPTSSNYPVWCIRTFPANAGNTYAYALMDPFLSVTAFGFRPVPINYPGQCQRTTHHIQWEKLTTQLDYRVFDYNDLSYSTDADRKAGMPKNLQKVTQGRNLIDRLFSTTALSQTIPYMRDKLHSVGETYGFIDLGISFTIMVDLTVAVKYNETIFRATAQCARATEAQGSPHEFSGILGQDDFLLWAELNWTEGKIACSYNPEYADSCDSTVQHSPFHPLSEDPNGVMLTQPASVVIEQTSSFPSMTLGCMRMRVSFNCSNFSYETCVHDELQEYVPGNMFKNFGAKTLYQNFTGGGTDGTLGVRGLCEFYFPEPAGPNNRKGWFSSGPDNTMNEDWRYWYRTHPCVRCQQALEICDYLNADEAIVNNIPVGLKQDNLGDKNAAVEITLGCFGDAVEDQCCDDASDSSAVPPFLSNCSVTLERCVRASDNYICARDTDGNGQCSGQVDTSTPGCNQNGVVCKDLPLCTPKGIISSLQ